MLESTRLDVRMVSHPTHSRPRHRMCWWIIRVNGLSCLVVWLSELQTIENQFRVVLRTNPTRSGARKKPSAAMRREQEQSSLHRCVTIERFPSTDFLVCGPSLYGFQACKRL